MAEIKVTQQMINEYRAVTGNYVLTDSAIAEKIKNEPLPEGFNLLAFEAQKAGYHADSSNLFGYGFDTNTDIGLTFERTTVPDNKAETKAEQPLTLGDFVEDLDKKSVSEAKKEKIYIKPFSKENFIENLGLRINSPDTEKILDRINSISHYFEIYEVSVDGKEIKEVLESNDLEPTFDNISNVMEILYGVTLRNEEELKATEDQRNKIIMQIQAANIMEHFFSLSAQWNDQYTDSLGLFGLGSEGIGYVINKLGLDGENHFQWADSCREWAERAGKLSVLNPEKFQDEFKKVYSDDGKYGIEFNEEKFNNLLELVRQEKIFDGEGELTKEGKDAILQAFNFVLDNPNASTYNQVMNGFGEALMMIATLGWGATTKGGQILATTSMATFSRAGVAIASKGINHKLLQGALRFTGKGVKLLGPAVNEGTKLAMYTATTGTLANATNRIVKADSEEDSWDKFLETEAMVMEGAKGSFAFGAFAGIYGSTVTQAVVQRVSKVSSKVTTALADKFAIGAVDASEVYTTAIAKSVPAGALEKATVELAAFATDVVGFTAFETAIALFDQVKNLPENEQPQKFTELLWEEFKGQGYNLGQIKIVSHLVIWLSGSRGARMASTEYLKQNLPQLKGATVEMIKNNRFKINLKDGRSIECKNGIEMLSSLNLMVRGETALDGKFDNNTYKSIKELQTDLKNKMGDAYTFYSKGNTELFSDKIYLELLNNLFKDGYNVKRYLDLKTFTNFKTSKESPNLYKILIELSKGKIDPFEITKFITDLQILDIKFVDLNSKDLKSIIKLQRNNVDSNVIFNYLRLKIENNNKSDIEILDNYSNRYAQISNKLEEYSFGDIVNELYALIKNIELSGELMTKDKLLDCIRKIEIKPENLQGENVYYAETDKNKLSILKQIIEKESFNENEPISGYFLEITQKISVILENSNNTRKLKNIKTIENNYSSTDALSPTIELSPKELIEYNSNKEYYIQLAGSPSTKQGEMGYEYNSKQKILSQALRDGYERYNSSIYFSENSSKKPSFGIEKYKYPPVIRFLDVSKSHYQNVPELIKRSFPKPGEVYQAKYLKCCFTTSIGSNEDFIAKDVYIEIHPKSESSNAYLVKGWGNEVRYGGDQKFKVIDKGYRILEYEVSKGIKRTIEGFVILQEY